MILEFKVENFLSIKDEQVLSFEATSDKHLEEYHTIEVKPGVKILKMAMIYGANASGKTNILKALGFLQDFATVQKRKNEEINFIPFKLNYKNINKPGKFEITFYIGKIKFIYNVILDEKIVYFEKLIYFSTRSNEQRLLFERMYNKNKENFELFLGSFFKDDKKDYKEILKTSTLNNSSIISSFSNLNIKLERNEVQYKKLDSFEKMLVRIYFFFSDIEVNPTKDFFLDDIMLEHIKNNDALYKEHILKHLIKADFNIIDYEIFETDIKYKSFENKYILLFTHKLNNIKGTFKLTEFEESIGTLMYFGLLAMSLGSLDGLETFIIDELENSLHPELVNHFINTFLYKSKNKRSQFIFTTHNINLLDEDFVRKDIVWFTEKGEDGSTKLFSLDEFNTDGISSYSKAYKVGNFGATPILDSVY